MVQLLILLVQDQGDEARDSQGGCSAGAPRPRIAQARRRRRYALSVKVMVIETAVWSCRR